MSFAALEAKLNQAAQARLGNATATWWPGGAGVGAPVPGIRLIIDREPDAAHAGGAVLDVEPVASVLAADVPGLARRDGLLIVRDVGDTTPRQYSVLRAEADSTGWVHLGLTEVTP